MGLRRVTLLAAAVAASCVLVPAAGGGDRRAPAPRLAEGRGQLHEVAPPPGIDRQDRRPCHRGRVLGLGAVAAEPARTCVVALHRRAQRPDRAARPPLGHRLARRQLEGQLPLGRDRARGLHVRPGRLHRRAVPRLGAPRRLDRAPLADADRPEHIIGHAQVPSPGGGRGGSSHHTDPGPHWNWRRYLQLVRRYAGFEKLSVTPTAPAGDATRRRPVAGEGDRWHHERRVLDQRPRRLGRPASAVRLRRRPRPEHDEARQRHARAPGARDRRPGRYDIARTTIVVDNKAFALTSAGARPWTKVRGTVKLRVRPWGAKAKRIVFRVDGHRREVDSRAPFLFAWGAKRAKPGRHVLQVVATSFDGRDASLRIPVVVSRPKPSQSRSRSRCHTDARNRRPEPRRRPAGDRARGLARRRDRTGDPSRVLDRRQAARHRPAAAVHARLGTGAETPGTHPH